MTKSGKALQHAKVTGFVSPHATFAIYFGSTAWCALLILAEAIALGQGIWDHSEVVIVCSMVLNGITYVAQTVDYIAYHFLLWPVTAINWAAQLSAIGTAAALLGFALAKPSGVPTSDRDDLLWMGIVHLVAQSLFTASQFAVTLEYFERRHQQSAEARACQLPTVVRRRG